MNSINLKKYGFAAFFLSGICAMSSGVIVSLLQEQYGFAYGMTGTLLSLMNIGNLTSSFASGVLPEKLGKRKTALILGSGYLLGYSLMAIPGIMGILIAAFILLGIAKGCALNNCTVLVGSAPGDKTKNMNIMHACYACGALSGPVLISLALLFHKTMPLFVLAFFGLLLWLVFFVTKFPESGKKDKKSSPENDWSFLKNKMFWLLTGLIFCQNAAETSVTGWLVTYYKSTEILSPAISNYTVTIMWSATLIARLLIAFVFPLKNRFKALSIMGIFCSIFYLIMIGCNAGIAAIILLFLFSFAMAGVNPTAVAGAGNLLNARSMGVMLPAAGLGAILMPFIIGIMADILGLKAGMTFNIVPCIGICVFSYFCMKFESKTA